MIYRFIATWIREAAGVVPGSALGRGSHARLVDAMIGGMLRAVFEDERKRKREERASRGPREVVAGRDDWAHEGPRARRERTRENGAGSARAVAVII